MIKLIGVFQAKKGMDPKEAWDYWQNHHAPESTGTQPEVKRYMINRAVAGFDGGEAPFLGVAEVYFDSLEAAEKAFTKPEWEAVFADAANCLDFDTAVLAWTEEHEIV